MKGPKTGQIVDKSNGGFRTVEIGGQKGMGSSSRLNLET